MQSYHTILVGVQLCMLAGCSLALFYQCADPEVAVDQGLLPLQKNQQQGESAVDGGQGRYTAAP